MRYQASNLKKAINRKIRNSRFAKLLGAVLFILKIVYGVICILWLICVILGPIAFYKWLNSISHSWITNWVEALLLFIIFVLVIPICSSSIIFIVTAKYLTRLKEQIKEKISVFKYENEILDEAVIALSSIAKKERDLSIKRKEESDSLRVKLKNKEESIDQNCPNDEVTKGSGDIVTALTINNNKYSLKDDNYKNELEGSEKKPSENKEKDDIRVIESLNEIFVTKESLAEFTEQQILENNYLIGKLSLEERLEKDLNKHNIGLNGELFVLWYEKNELIKNGRTDLADKIVHVSKFEGDYLGYDIRSYDHHGAKKYIEVKTSVNNYTADFYLTGNEMNKIDQLENYFIYRVFNFDIQAGIGDLYIINCKKDFGEYFNIRPIKFAISPIVK